MQCDKIRNYFADFLIERLTPGDQAALSRHLQDCPSCPAELQQWADIWVRMGALPAVEVRDEDRSKASARLRRAIEDHKANGRRLNENGRLWRISLVTAAAVLIVLGSLAVIQRRSTPDGAANVAEAAENTLFRTWGGQTDALEVGGKIESGEIIHTDGAGAVLALADGSSLEMRADTELWLEHADDGLRIRLRKGGIIVDAAGMRGEHLYVQTKDMTASVVGTVFLVNAAEEGTRVAVIEGEVHVQQGASAQTLVRGEQVTTSPLMEPPPFGEDISWSRNAETHLVLLRQSIAPAAEEAFEIASVRPGPGLSGCGNFSVYITLDYFSATCATVYHLVDLAYGLKNCQVAQTLEPPCFYGGPAWARSDPFHIEAVLPHGSPGYTRSELQAGHAPKLQRMIQRLLVDRFKLTVHREMKGKKGKDAIAPAEILVITHLEKPTVN